MGDVIPMSSPDKLEQMKGPSLYGCAVVVDGHEVPNLWMVDKGETIEVCFPGPVHYIVPRDFAVQALHIAAKAMAIGAGHSHVSSAHAMTKPYGRKVMWVGSAEGQEKQP